MSTNDAPSALPSTALAISNKHVAQHKASVPSVAIYACGGFGINIVRSLRPQLEAMATVRFIDTSRSNIGEGDDLILIASGDGSGKIRAEHAPAIQKKINAMTPESLGVADVNVIIFSLSGGSGSVIGPVLMGKIASTGNRVVIMTVADTASELDARNSLNTLKTVQNIVNSNDAYVQIMPFDNIVGKPKADRTVRHRLQQLVTLEVAAAAELDRNDRRNWLNAQRLVGVSAGLRLLHVVGGVEPDDDAKSGQIWTYEPDHVYDAMLSIGVYSDDAQGDVLTTNLAVDVRSRFDGIFITSKLTPMVGLVSGDASGAAPLVKQIEDRLARFASQPRSGTTLVRVDDVDASNGGLVL